jgi:hypothetical protein
MTLSQNNTLPQDVPMADNEAQSPSPPPPNPAPMLTESGRPKRNYRLPARYEDVPPVGPAPIQSSPHPQMAPGSLALPRVILHVRDFMRTCRNSFGVLREYPHRPSYDPDTSVPEENLCNYPTQPTNPTNTTNKGNHDPPWPFQNMSIYLLMEWIITGSGNKSIGEMDRLANVLRAKEFKLADLADFSARRENGRFDVSEGDLPDSPYSHDGWIVSSVGISVPTGLKELGGKGQPFVVPGLHRRSLLAVVKAALVDVTARRFHFSPFKRFWKPALGIEVRCFDEAYTSDAWLEAHSVLQKQRNESGCQLEKVILGLMFWSDSTHLANFGTAKVWHLYLYFGNLSKYFRGKPSSGASHHVAYIPSVCVPCHDTCPFLLTKVPAAGFNFRCHYLWNSEESYLDSLPSRFDAWRVGSASR